jgi:N-methylhydantoinase A
MQLDREAAERAIHDRIAAPLDMSVPEAAWGIHQIVNESMANAARVHAIERGKDPRSFPLFAFGGAGPVHAYRVAEILHAPSMIAPFGAGVTSTVGFLAAPLAFDFVRTSYGRLDELDWEAVNAIFDELEASGRRILLDSGVADEDMSVSRAADFRYIGQGYEVRTPVPRGRLTPELKEQMVAAFEQVYRQLYGREGPAVGVEVVNWRVQATGPKPHLSLNPDDVPAGSAHDAIKGERPVYHPEWREHRPTPVYDRYRLAPGTTIDGPAIVEERESTVVVGPGARFVIDQMRNLRVEM